MLFGEISGIDFTDVPNTSGEGFELLYSESARGLTVQVVGESLIADGGKKETSIQSVKISGKVKKAWLLWSGEVKDEDSQPERIKFVTPRESEITVQADRIWRGKSSGTLYSAAADVTKHLKKSGDYGVKDLPSDSLHFYGTENLSVAGWALFVVEKKRDGKETAIQISATLQILKPGELYDFNLAKEMPKGNWSVQHITLVGGHGRAGNGSASLLNGKALRGTDEWNGSSGTFWDIDTFSLKNLEIQSSKDGLLLTIDPLLQWLYPMAVALESEAIQ